MWVFAGSVVAQGSHDVSQVAARLLALSLAFKLILDGIAMVEVILVKHHKPEVLAEGPEGLLDEAQAYFIFQAMPGLKNISVSGRVLSESSGSEKWDPH